MDSKTRNLELETWLIETTGEEMMANHLGPNWNRFNDEFGFYPNISMTIADQVWQHQQAKVEGLLEEFAEDERFLKEQIKDKDSKISNLEYLQGMDKELIQSLQSMSEKLQKRVDAFKDHAVMFRKAAKSYAYTEREQNILLSQADDIEKILGLEQALKGEG